MVTKRMVENYVDSQPTILKSCFARFLDNKDSMAQEALDAVLLKLQKQLASAGFNYPESTWFKDAVNEFDAIEPLLHILQGESLKEKKSLSFKLKKALFGGVLEEMLGYVLGFDFSSLNNEERLLAGDAIALSAIYKHL